MTLHATCMSAQGNRFSGNVRLQAVDAERNVRSVMLYDLKPAEIEAFVAGRKYVVTIEEAKPE